MKRIIAGIETKTIAAVMPMILVALAMGGCGGGSTVKSTSSTSDSEVQTYMMAPIAGVMSGDGSSIMQSLGTYTIDDTALNFTQSSYSFTGTQEGAQLNYSGEVTTLSRGLLSLGIDYVYGGYGINDCTGTVSECSASGVTYSTPLTGNWAIELADQAGGLVQLKGLPFTPLVAANDCPDYSTAKTFQFVTLPAALTTGDSGSYGWNSTYDTAYGSVDIGGSGSTITFDNIKQYTSSGTLLTSYEAMTDDPAAITSTTGACSSTFYGDGTVSVPGYETITDPGAGETITPTALVGIGSSGLLLENNGDGTSYATNTSATAAYQPFLGAGMGAIGLPKPSSAVDATALTGAQYLGFIYNIASTTSWSSVVASFGFSSQPSTCSSVATATSTMIYGGDFPSNDPSSTTVQSGGGFGNCDVAIDLGTQDSSNNGLFPSATVYMGKGYTANTAGKTYSFPATAISGQLDGKYAIFLIGVDSTTKQAWGIYLLQSN